MIEEDINTDLGMVLIDGDFFELPPAVEFISIWWWKDEGNMLDTIGCYRLQTIYAGQIFDYSIDTTTMHLLVTDDYEEAIATMIIFTIHELIQRLWNWHHGVR